MADLDRMSLELSRLSARLDSHLDGAEITRTAIALIQQSVGSIANQLEGADGLVQRVRSLEDSRSRLVGLAVGLASISSLGTGSVVIALLKLWA